MELNADFTQRALVHSERIAWVPSPMPGVERRMLDRVGGEVARATSIVRYAPNSYFSAHVHGGGEEFLVLDGVFQDEHGRYPVGYYIRNPPTSQHSPGSESGCTIFVKLCQFDPADRSHTRINTRKMRYLPSVGRPGVELMPLFHDGREDVRMERWAPGANVSLTASGGLELLVLEGSFTDGDEKLVLHSWLRLPAGYVLKASTATIGCTVWVKSASLENARGAHEDSHDDEP